VRLALISDIHGNGVGLEAVLDELKHERVDGFGLPHADEASRRLA
jgi:hypothetical protein